MKKMIRNASAAFAVMTFVVGVAVAQESKPTVAPAPEPRASAQRPQVPLKLQLVLSRYQGEKKISSVPYSLWLTTHEGRTSLRMGVQMPVPQGMIGGNTPSPVMTYTLKDVGTNIDCSAETGAEPGVFKIYLVVTDSTALPTSSLPAGKVGEGQQVAMPAFSIRNFSSTFNILLRDGQTAQYTTATDPVNGEVLKIDATLNVLK